MQSRAWLKRLDQMYVCVHGCHARARMAALLALQQGVHVLATSQAVDG